MSCYPGHFLAPFVAPSGPPRRFLPMPGASPPMHAARGGFEPVETPVDATFVDVAVVGEAAFAVGEGGVVLEHAPRTDGWTLRDDGEWPSKAGADRVDPPALTAVDATADRERVWFAGENGCVGYFDAKRDTALDLTPQTEDQASFTGLAVVGPTRRERVFVADADGRLVEADVNGTTASFDPPKRMAGGAEITGLAPDGAGGAVGCDAEGHVFYWTAAAGWRVWDVTDRRLAGVAAAGAELLLATADGDVLRYEPELGETLVERTDADAFADIAACAEPDGTRRALAVGQGVVAEGTATGWAAEASPVDAYGVDCGGRDVAVGAAGAVLER